MYLLFILTQVFFLLNTEKYFSSLPEEKSLQVLSDRCCFQDHPHVCIYRSLLLLEGPIRQLVRNPKESGRLLCGATCQLKPMGISF